MPDNKFRIATFNVQNLFKRVAVFSQRDPNVGEEALKNIGKLQTELNRSTYNKQEILRLYNLVKKFITISEDKGKLWKKRGYTIIGVQADGRKDWDGSIVFKTANYNETERSNTARVIRNTKADILCMVEVEDKPTLRSFDSHLMSSRYPYEMLIDAMDPRGIDVGLYSKFPIGGVWTHMYDKKNNKSIFSRDCLEVQLLLPGNRTLYILCNHFKSKGYGSRKKGNEKRKRQAERVKEIIESKYDLERDLVAVAGDFNDTPESAPLQPLMSMNGLKDVLELQFPNNPKNRWTYHFKSNQQIDFMLVSGPLQSAFTKAKVERKGIYNLSGYTKGKMKSFDTVTSPANQASDHAAVWAEFDLNRLSS